jgi:nucleoid DNA-binding protein
MRELVQAFAARTGMSEDHAHDVVQEFVAAFIDTLGREGEVRLANLGTFDVRRRAPRSCRNPRTGARMTIPAHFHVFFKPAAFLKARVDLMVTEQLSQLAQREEPEE